MPEVRLNKAGKPIRSKAQYDRLRKAILKDYAKTKRPYAFYEWKYEVSKCFVQKTVSGAGLSKGTRGAHGFRPKIVPHSYLSCFFDEWKRPKGMDAHLREIANG